MSESRGGESRSYSSYTPSYSSYGESRSSSESRTSSSSYQSSYGESRESAESRNSSYNQDNYKVNKKSNNNPYDSILLSMYAENPKPELEGTLEALGLIPKISSAKQRRDVIESIKCQDNEKAKSQDIGDIRSQVMQELYDELYGEIKDEVRQELEKEKPEIVREIKDEVKEKLKADLKRNLTQGRGEER